VGVEDTYLRLLVSPRCSTTSSFVHAASRIVAGNIMLGVVPDEGGSGPNPALAFSRASQSRVVSTLVIAALFNPLRHPGSLLRQAQERDGPGRLERRSGGDNKGDYAARPRLAVGLRPDRDPKERRGEEPSAPASQA
jgi:hypothetical protein